MADEKLNTGQEENSQPSLFDAGPESPAPENVPEQTGGEPHAQDAPAPEPPAPENTPEQAAGEKEPDKKGKAAKEKTPVPEDKPKDRRDRKPKEEKAGPGEPGGMSTPVIK